jgi:hypothetical protein
MNAYIRCGHLLLLQSENLRHFDLAYLTALAQLAQGHLLGNQQMGALIECHATDARLHNSYEISSEAFISITFTDAR